MGRGRPTIMGRWFSPLPRKGAYTYEPGASSETHGVFTLASGTAARIHPEPQSYPATVFPLLSNPTCYKKARNAGHQVYLCKTVTIRQEKR